MQHRIEKIDTRSTLAFMWSLACIWFVGFILVKHGDKVEILTLMIGLIGGTIIGGIFGTYFNANVDKRNPPPVIPPDATIENVNTEEISGPVTTNSVTQITES